MDNIFALSVMFWSITKHFILKKKIPYFDQTSVYRLFNMKLTICEDNMSFCLFAMFLQPY